MKKLVRSVFDPSPRSLSVKSLAVLVGMLTCGIGISVHEYLESASAGVHASAGTPVVGPQACKQDPCRAFDPPRAMLQVPPSSSTSTAQDREVPSEPCRSISQYQGSNYQGSSHPSSGSPGASSTQWSPDGLPGAAAEESETHAGSCSVDETGRVGSVSIW